MKLEVKENTPRSMTLLLEDVDHSFVNALRRTLLAEVPKMALEDVTIYDNTSALFDEIVAHRLGLVPIPTDLQAFNRRDACVCEGEGCANCTILYTLSKEGPTMVLSGDLTPADPSFKVPDPNVPIVKLLEGQRLMLEAGAILGTGTENAKWAPVHGAGYKEVPHLDVGGVAPLTAEQATGIGKTAPPGSVAVEDGRIRVLDEEKAFVYLKSAAPLYKIEGIKFWTDKNRFLFRFETDGALTPKDALSKAARVVMEKLKHVETEAAKLKLEDAPAA